MIDAFDHDKSGCVSLNEFIRAIRGDINAARMSWINAAYKKLDVNGDGSVTLDDIAKLFDVSCHPDVQNGRNPADAYNEFMGMWDTDVVDGKVTIEEFTEYFKDISASIEGDDMFAAMMRSAWKLA